MKGKIKWYSAISSTGEFQYDLGQKDFDTDKKSIRYTIADALYSDWNTFGEDGDTIIIVADNEEEE